MSKEALQGRQGLEVEDASIGSVEPQSSGRLLDVLRPPIASLPLPQAFDWFEGAVGPLIEGATILLSGAPGSCKSTLTTELCLQLGSRGIKTLSVPTEESPQRLLTRAVRLSSDWSKEAVQSAIANMHCDSTLLDLYNLPAFLWANVLAPSARHAGCRAIIIDSVQGDGVPANAHRSYSRLYEFTRQAKSAGITTILVAHQTKRGQIAGPRGLEHHVDQVLILRKAMDARLLFVSKNRYGRENLRGVPLAIDQVSGALRPSPYTEPTAGVARTYSGATFGATEIQALIELPRINSKPQVHAQGLPQRRVQQLLACVARVPGIDLADLDVTINCMLPGEGLFRAAHGLALCMAIVSTLLRKPITPTHLFLGEVDLRRAIRTPSISLLDDLNAAIAQEELRLPLRIICPSAAAARISPIASAEVVTIDTLDDAIRQTYGDHAAETDQ